MRNKKKNTLKVDARHIVHFMYTFYPISFPLPSASAPESYGHIFQESFQ